MSDTLFSINPFLAFLDMHPQALFDVTEGEHCAYAQYLIACGMSSPHVSDMYCKFTDAMGRTRTVMLPVEMGSEHCNKDDDEHYVSFARLAKRIRHRMTTSNKYRDTMYIVMRREIETSIKSYTIHKELYECTN